MLPKALERELGTVSPTDLTRLEPLCAAARQAVLEHGIPETVATAVTTAYAELGEGISVAVRSSATDEDQPWASFAGQYTTFLNVIGPDELLERVLQVWASLYSTSAVAYRLRLGLDLASTFMATVVQQQLRPHAAGVLFTHDPVSGDEDHIIVNVALGLGEGVVAGSVPTDTYTVSTPHGKILSQTVSTKDAMVDLVPDGGTQRVSVSAEQRTSPALKPKHVSELVQLASRIRDLFGNHQDIEFAVHNDEVWLLQARPTTGINAPSPFSVIWPHPDDANHAWVRDQFGGQGPSYKLQEDATRAHVEGRRVCFEETGAPMARNSVLEFFNGYPYVRSPVDDGTKIRERQEEFTARALAYWESGTSLYEAEIRPEVEQTLALLASFRPRRASLPSLVEHLEQALRAYGRVMGDLHWRMSAGMRQDWPSIYQEITGEAPVASGGLLQAIPNKTTHLVRRLRNLARLAQREPELQEIFRDRSYHRLQEALLRNRPAVQRFRNNFHRLLRSYGFRNGRGFGSGAGFTNPTWNMDPSQPLDLIGAYARQDLNRLGRMEARARQSRHTAERRVRRMLAGGSERLIRFEQAFARAVDEVKRMENHNHIMEQGISGVLREAIHWIGQGLVRRGLLESAGDILHLSLAELTDVATGGGPADLNKLVNQRAEQFQACSRLRPRSTLGKAGPMGPLPPNPRAIYDLPLDAGVDGLVLRGTGASPGKVTGRARVVPMTPAPPAVENADILVAENVGPAWTPILPLIAGLVLDAGAVFQHAALVAREYGIPAIVMTRDATSVIMDGQTITVDADQNIVHLVPEERGELGSEQ